MSNEYDIALIKQVVKQGPWDTVVDRVINTLHPGAPSTAETRTVARGVLEKMFDEGEIKCPRCATNVLDAETFCFGDELCPVTAE